MMRAIGHVCALMGLMLAINASGLGDEKPGDELLKQLNAKAAGIQNLSCQLLNNDGEHMGQIRFKKGVGIRIDHVDYREKTMLTVWTTNKTFCKMDRSLGLVQAPRYHKDMSVYMTALLMPLLTPDQIKHVGVLTEVKSSKKGCRILRLTPKTRQEPYGRREASSIMVHFEMATGKAFRVDLGFGERVGYTQFIVNHQHMNGFPIPATLGRNQSANAETFMHLVKLRDAESPANVFVPDVRYAIRVKRFTQNRFGAQPTDTSVAVAEMLTSAKSDLEKAGIYYGSIVSQYGSLRGISLSTARFDEVNSTLAKASKLAPKCVAPKLLQVGLLKRRDPAKWKTSLKQLVVEYPQSRSVIYAKLLDGFDRINSFSSMQEGKDLSEEIVWARDWAAIAPTNPFAQNALACVLHVAGKHREAAKQIRSRMVNCGRIQRMVYQGQLVKVLSEENAWDELSNAVDQSVSHIRNMFVLHGKRRDSSWYDDPSPSPDACLKALNGIVWSIRSIHRRKNTLPAYKAKLKKSGDPASLYLLSSFAGSDKKTAEQIEYLEALRKHYPNLELIDSSLAYCYQKAGQGDKALQLRKESLTFAAKHASPRDYASAFTSYQYACKELKRPELFEEAINDVVKSEMPEDLLRHIMSYYEKSKKREQAIRACEKLLETSPALKVQVLGYLGRYYGEEGKPEKALSLYRKIIPTLPSKIQRSQAKSQMLMLAAKLGKTDQVEAELKKMEADAKTPEEKQRVAQYRMYLTRTPRTPVSTGSLEAKLKKNPKDLHSLKMLANIYRSRGRTAEAIKLYERYLSIETDKYVISSLLQCKLQTNDKAAAVAFYEKHEKALAGSHFQNGMLIAAYKSLGKHGKAAKLLEKDFDDYPEYGKAVRLLKLYAAAGDLKSAEKWRLKAAKLTGDQKCKDALAIHIAPLYIKLKQFDKAEALYEAACMENVWEGGDPKRALRDHLVRTKRLKQYMSRLQQRVDAAPKNVKLLRFFCEFLVQGNYGRADYGKVADYRGKIVKLSPTRHDYSSWVSALTQAKKYAEALAAHKEMITKYPAQSSSDVTFYLGTCARAGKYAEAEEVAEAYLKKAPGDAGYVHHQLAESYAQAKKIDEAAKHYKLAIAVAREPHQRRQWKMDLMRLLRWNKRPDEAEEIGKAILRDETDGNTLQSVLYSLRDILRKKKEWDTFKTNLERESKASPKDLASQKRLTQLYMMERDWEKASAQARIVVALAPTEKNYRSLGRALSEGKKYSKLADMYAEQIKRFPLAKAQHQQSLINACERAGDYDRAISVVEESIESGSRSYARAAKICAKAKRYDKAIAYYEKAVKGHNDDYLLIPNQIGLVECYLAVKQYAKAEKLLKTMQANTRQAYYKRQINALLKRVPADTPK